MSEFDLGEPLIKCDGGPKSPAEVGSARSAEKLGDLSNPGF